MKDLKKIIVLSVSGVLALTGSLLTINFSSGSGRGKSIAKCGAGNGTNEKVETAKDMGEILSKLPDSSNYESETGGVSPFGAKRAASDNDFLSYTITDTADVHSEYEKDIFGRQKSKSDIVRNMTAYFTKDAVYYVCDSNAYSYFGTNYSSGEYLDYTESTMNISMEMYLSKEDTYIKYINYELDNKSVKNGSVVEVEENPAFEKTLESISKIYGKWVDLNDTGLSKFENMEEMDPTSQDSIELMMDAMVAYGITEIAGALKTTLRDVNDQNLRFLKNISQFYLNADAFVSKGGSYDITDEYFNAYVNAAYGINESILKDLVAEKSTVSLSLSDQETPVITHDLDLSSSDNLNKLTASETISFANIGNTVVELTGKASKTAYTWLEPLLKDLFTSQAGNK